MNFTLSQVEEVETPFREEFLREVCRRTLEKIDFLKETTTEIEIGVASVSGERIQELNQEYRGKDKVTDILSFGADENWLERGSIPEGKTFFLGDLIYCPSFIIEAAREDEVSEEHEMCYIFSHGILHLLGYDHSDEMFTLQDEVTEELLNDKEAAGENNP